MQCSIFRFNSTGPIPCRNISEVYTERGSRCFNSPASGLNDHNAESTCSQHFSQVWPPIVFNCSFCLEQEKGIVYQICQRISGEVEKDRTNKPKTNASGSEAPEDLHDLWLSTYSFILTKVTHKENPTSALTKAVSIQTAIR